MNSQINSLINKINSENFDCMILSQNTNIFYISGVFPSSTAFLLLKDNPILFVSKMDIELAKNAIGNNNCGIINNSARGSRDSDSRGDNTNNKCNIELRELKSIYDIKNTIESEKINNVAIEESLTIGTYKKLKGNFNLATTKLINNVRMIKSKEELLNIEKALNIASESFIELCDSLMDYNSNFSSKEGQISEKTIAYELVNNMGINGAEKESFDTIVAIGSK
ncbi:MAG: aminopeptidase P family N-terminal domain-containing protein, partial [Methanobacteriaceae archaeon]